MFGEDSKFLFFNALRGRGRLSGFGLGMFHDAVDPEFSVYYMYFVSFGRGSVGLSAIEVLIFHFTVCVTY